MEYTEDQLAVLKLFANEELLKNILTKDIPEYKLSQDEFNLFIKTISSEIFITTNQFCKNKSRAKKKYYYEPDYFHIEDHLCNLNINDFKILDILIEKLLAKGAIITQTYFELLCLTNYYDLIYRCLNNKLIPSDTCLNNILNTERDICLSLYRDDNAVLYTEYTYNNIKLLIDNGIQPTDKSLLYACKNWSKNIIGSILNVGIVPTEEHFKILIDNKFNGHRTTKKLFDINILFNYNYKIDLSTLQKIMESKYNNRKMKNLDVKHLGDLDVPKIEFCKKYSIPIPKNIDKKLDITRLQNACLFDTTANIQKLIKTHKLAPDNICLENACKSGNPKLVDLILSENVAINSKCMELFIESKSKDREYLLKLFKLYDTTVKTIKPVDKKNKN